MREINQNNCMQILLEKFPNFMPYWKAFIEYWGDDWQDCGPGIKLGSFLDYTEDMIKKGDQAELKRIFYSTELMVCKGDESVKNAATTSFLESLINRGFHFDTFSKFLGKQSVKYCQAWDEFCGVETPGLYYDPISFKYEWEKDFEMEVKIENDKVVLKANKAGLISLANQLLNLARDEMPAHEVLEFDQDNALNNGSNPLIIQKS